MTSPDTFGSAPPPRVDDLPTAPVGADHALEVLLTVGAEIAPELPEDLLRQCYAIQKRFQFDRDEQLPIVHTRRLVEGFVERDTAPRATAHAESDA